MRLLEHQSKTLLSGFGLAFTQAAVVDSAEAAVEIARQIDGPVVLKAQVPFGGRGKAGAVKFAESSVETRLIASELLALELRGLPVRQISVEPRVEFEAEFYLGVTWDTGAKLPVALLGSAGGVEVESATGAMARRTFDPRLGLPAYLGREMAREIGEDGKAMVALGNALEKLARAFLGMDGVTMEINPLVRTADGFIGLDAHVEIDDDAAPRQVERLRFLGPLAEHTAGRAPTPFEQEAARIDAMDHRGVAGRVVEFDGDLGLLIGGGGASLTVFDAIRRHGGKPANYCEVGGNPTEEKVAALTKLLLTQPRIRKVAVIMNVVNNTRADVMARGVLMGVREAGLEPADAICLFRIPGSWEQEARALLAENGVVALGRESSLDACAKLAVERMNSHAA